MFVNDYKFQPTKFQYNIIRDENHIGFCIKGIEGSFLTELPSISTSITHNEGCHWLISRSRLKLIVGAILLFAFSAF